MIRATRIAALLVASCLPFAAFAQDAAAPVDDLTTDTPSADAPAPDAAGTDTAAPREQPGGNLSTGEASTQEPSLYVRETHGDWQVRCLRAPEGQVDPCQLYQRLNDAEGNPTADVNFFALPEGAELAGGATIVTPLQTLLTAQVTMTVDGGQPRRYPFAFCDPEGCYARLGFTEADMAQFRRGSAATIVVVPALAPDQPAQLSMSLSGFTAGITAIGLGG